MDGEPMVVRRGADNGEIPEAGACSSGEKTETVSGFSGDVDGAAALADRLRRAGTPITFYRYPEAVFGAGDRNVRAVKAAAAKAGRTWREGGAEHRKALDRLASVLGGTDTGRLRYWAGVTMIDRGWCGASGAGGYWAVVSRLVNEGARAELRRRGDAWRAVGLGPIATVEAVRAAGFDEAGLSARRATGEIPPARRVA